MNFHDRAGKLMKKIRCAPRIHQFSGGIYQQTGLAADEINLLRILPRERGSDFGIIPHRIAAKHRAVLVENAVHVLQNRRGRKIRK